MKCAGRLKILARDFALKAVKGIKCTWLNLASGKDGRSVGFHPAELRLDADLMFFVIRVKKDTGLCSFQPAG